MRFFCLLATNLHGGCMMFRNRIRNANERVCDLRCARNLRLLVDQIFDSLSQPFFVGLARPILPFTGGGGA